MGVVIAGQGGMANPEHLRILRNGVEAWNLFREETQNAPVDLSYEDLRRCYLGNANLFRAHLVESKLCSVDMRGSNLSYANLERADLSCALLDQAKIKEANFNHANLYNAIFSGADLTGSTFKNAKLHGVKLYYVLSPLVSFDEADLSNAFLSGGIFGQSSFCDANLTEAEFKGAQLTLVNFRGARLYHSNLEGISAMGAYFIKANLDGANFFRAFLQEADFTDANMQNANLCEADLKKAKFIRAVLQNAKLTDAGFQQSDFSEANLSGADLRHARLVETSFKNTNLSNCSIYGISAWNLNLNGAEQSGLLISNTNEPYVTVDNLEVAQFIYLLLNNEKIRTVIDTITSKVVLILGRFTPERKAILDVLRKELRAFNYLPVIFDFEKPLSRNMTETVSTLAHMARFIIADITDAKSIPQELQRIVPHLPSVPVQPIILDSQFEYGMFQDFLDHPWVLHPFRYKDIEELLVSLLDKVIRPAVIKANEVVEKRKTRN